ncbi:hypothetical protein ACJP8O_003168 [Enterobacter hormaechei]|uniref:hypothetical protein n=1 Tax=Enterobacter hormaechei TaxID=158836 RepID=UPI001CD8EFF0|nr:hypothetical protein [Enterobacter hormaechei]ELD3460008.1 hypothetical protein [Enterobacter hormaechei]HDS5274159.1 hypothetical protein [Enterobacter hormaechei subsp. steigerwaltii]
MKLNYEELEAKCAALAAELRAVEAIHNEAVFITDDRYEQCPPEVQKIIRSLAVMQIPAYHAFLAEVRAQAIESLLTESFRADIAGALADFDGMDEQSLQTLIWSGQPPEPDGDVWCVEYMSRAAAVLRKVREFAAQLRKGVRS